MAQASKAFAVIAGVGPGTGAACARRFAKSYPVALLARSKENFESLAEEINKTGGKAIGISTDVSDEKSVKAAFEKIQTEFGTDICAAAIFNASGRFARAPLLEMKVDDFVAGYEVSVKGALIFSQATLPLLLNHAKSNSKTANSNDSSHHPPTLIFTGATASVKANAQMGGFASSKFALRALSTSIAKEFASKGVHVAHAQIDGVIDIPRTKDWLKELGPEGKIDPNDIAETYFDLHKQSVRCFTNEIDVRPMMEKW